MHRPLVAEFAITPYNSSLSPLLSLSELNYVDIMTVSR